MSKREIELEVIDIPVSLKEEIAKVFLDQV